MTTFAVVGDSISAPSYQSGGFTNLSGFYLPMLGAAMKWEMLTNTAVPGLTLHTAVGMLPQLIPNIPDHLIVNLGTNDAYHMSDTGHENGTSFQADWVTLHNYINGLLPKPTVTVLGLLPTLYGFGCPWAYNDAWLIRYMDLITETQAYAAGAYFVPLTVITQDMIRSDNHPKPEAHARMAGLIMRKWGVS